MFHVEHLIVICKNPFFWTRTFFILKSYVKLTYRFSAALDWGFFSAFHAVKKNRTSVLFFQAVLAGERAPTRPTPPLHLP
jgi:hypothetical protein